MRNASPCSALSMLPAVKSPVDQLTASHPRARCSLVALLRAVDRKFASCQSVSFIFATGIV